MVSFTRIIAVIGYVPVPCRHKSCPRSGPCRLDRLDALMLAIASSYQLTDYPETDPRSLAVDDGIVLPEEEDSDPCRSEDIEFDTVFAEVG